MEERDIVPNAISDADNCVGGQEWRARLSGLQVQLELALPEGRPFINLIPLILEYVSGHRLWICERCKRNYASVARICFACGARAIQIERNQIIVDYLQTSASSFRGWTWPCDITTFPARCLAMNAILMRYNRYLTGEDAAYVYRWVTERRPRISDEQAKVALSNLWEPPRSSSSSSERSASKGIPPENSCTDDDYEWDACATLLAFTFASTEHEGTILLPAPSRPITKAMDAISHRFKRMDTDRLTPFELSEFLRNGPVSVLETRRSFAARELRLYRSLSSSSSI